MGNKKKERGTFGKKGDEWKEKAWSPKKRNLEMTHIEIKSPRGNHT